MKDALNRFICRRLFGYEQGPRFLVDFQNDRFEVNYGRNWFSTWVLRRLIIIDSDGEVIWKGPLTSQRPVR